MFLICVRFINNPFFSDIHISEQNFGLSRKHEEPLTRGWCHQSRIYLYRNLFGFCIVVSRSSVSLAPAASPNVPIMSALTMKWLLLAVPLFFNIVVEEISAQYVPPTPTVEPLYPKGLRMSIPHEDGITLVAYHVKFNEDFNGLEAGTIAIDIVRMKNGRWTYEDRTTRLKRGDIIYYWVHVVYDRLGYNLLDQQHVVNDFYNYDGTPVTGSSGDVVCATPSETKIFETDQRNQQLKRRNVCPGQLIFEENFDTLNTSRWWIFERFSDVPSYEFVVYMNNNDNVEVKDGALHIRPVLMNSKYGKDFVLKGSLNLQRCTGQPESTECKRKGRGSYILPPVISGRLNTMNSFNFLYGHVQVRAKLPRGDWIYPLITLQSAEKQTDNATLYCDIIIAHAVGNPSLRTSNGVDLSAYNLLAGAHAITVEEHFQQNNQLNLPKRSSSTMWSDDYHVYDLEWRSGRVTVKVDGEQYGEQKVPALYDSPVYITLGLAVGGHTVFPDACISGNYIKPWRNVASKALYHFYLAANDWENTWTGHDTGLHIDYVKVWAI